MAWGGKKKPKGHSKTLSIIHAQWVVEYLKTANATTATKIIYPNNKFPGMYAVQLMKMPAIKEAIARERQRTLDKGGYNIERAMKEADDAIQFSRDTDNANAYVKAVELKAKLNGLLIEKHDIRTAGAFSIVINGLGAVPIAPQLEPPPKQIEAKDVTVE